MNEIIPFNFEDTAVRVILFGDCPWFVANDVATVLGYSQTHHMLRMLDEDERGIQKVDTLGGSQDMTIISESGLFAAILKSRRVEARRFRRWVTGEVLPALRRTGQYALDGAGQAAPGILDMEPGRVMAAVTVVREARRLFGPDGARSVWRKIGLPAPIALAGEGIVDDLASALAAHMDGRAHTTAKDAARALGFADPDHFLRKRIGETLARMGYVMRQCRREGRKDYWWMRAGPAGFEAQAAETLDGEA